MKTFALVPFLAILLIFTLSLYTSATSVIAVSRTPSLKERIKTSRKEELHKREMIKSIRTQVIRGGLSGAVGGALQVITLMWLRTLTTYQYRYGCDFYTAFIELYNEGGIGRFYRGWQYALIQGPLVRFGSVAANELATLFFTVYNFKFSFQLTQILVTLIGGLLVTLWRALLMPIDTCKTVSQVEGAEGLAKLLDRVFSNGEINLLFQGTSATLLATFTGHYPWFLVHNYLEATVAKPTLFKFMLLRTAGIGFIATAFSDIVTNSLRVVKTVKQAVSAEGLDLSYSQVIAKVFSEGGLSALFGRGLLSRILSNGLQSVIFTVVWKLLVKHLNDRDQAHKKKEDDKIAQQEGSQYTGRDCNKDSAYSDRSSRVSEVLDKV